MEPVVLSDPSVQEQARVFATLVSAFRADPVERWLYPDDDHYDEKFVLFLAAFSGPAFRRGTAWRLDDYAAVALWIPPHAQPDGADITRVLSETVASVKHADAFTALEQMDVAHPAYPHWYLPWFGVAATMQSQGLGSRLMTACLAAVDDTGLPAYLETPNPRTISFYSRHGFEITGVTDAGSCPPITFMLRTAR